jgi:hypothetical protein
VARYTVVEDTSETLLGILGAAVLRAFPAAANRPTVQLAGPDSFDGLPPAGATPPVLTIWLYRIAPDATKRNGPRRIMADGSVGRPLLPLVLHYLITPWSADINTTHALAGLIAQAMYDRAEVGGADLRGALGRPAAWDEGDSIQVQMEDLGSEELHRFWDTADKPFQLSLGYRVQVVGVEPSESTSAYRVTEAVLVGAGEM